MFRGRSYMPGRRAFAVTTTTTLAVGSAYLYFRPQPIRLEDASSVYDVKRPVNLSWKPPTRDQMLAHLGTSGIYVSRTQEAGPELGEVKGEKKESEDDDIFDLLIVGGGATGAGTALDAVSRGLKVACVERDDFSSGTSSKSTKLVHGGVRYLQKAIFELDYGECWPLLDHIKQAH